MATVPPRCHSCGAPAPRAAGSTTCTYCGLPLVGPEPPVPPKHDPPRQVAPASAPRSPMLWIGAWIGVVGAVSATSAMLSQGRQAELMAAGPGADAAAGGGPVETPSELAAVIPDGAGGDDVLAFFTRDDKHQLGRLRGATLEAAWRTPLTAKNINLAEVAVSASTAFVAAEERLFAFDLASGALRWEVGLVAPAECDTCLRVIGDRVVTRQKDGTMQAFDPATGAVAWTRRDPDGYAELPVVGGKIFTSVADDRDKFALVDPQTGTPGAPADARCRSASGRSWDATVAAKQTLATTPDGNSAVLVLGHFDTCVVRWDAATGKPAWSTWLKDRYAIRWHERGGFLLDPSGVYLAGDEVVTTIDLATGKPRELMRDPQSAYHLRFVHEGLLFITVTPDWDSRKHSLWAVGLDGAQKWQFKLAATDLGRGFELVPVPGGVVVWQASDDEKAVVAERLDIKTGQPTYRQVLTTSPYSTPTVWGQLQSPRRVWFRASSDTVTFDLATGESKVLR